MEKYKDGTYIVKDGKIYEVQIDIPRMMGAEVIHVALKDFKKQTNGDRIRSMSDEELALTLNCIPNSGGCIMGNYYDMDCERCILDWLRKEAGDE